jgi:DNA-binding IclR family transcriptional regulator
MSSSWLRGLKSREVIRSVMNELAEEVPGIIAMTVRDGFDMVLIECCRAATTVGVFSQVGSRRSVAHTASGRAYLLMQTAAQSEQFLKELARKSPADARKLAAWLRKNEATFKSNGITTASGEDHPQINGIAVPVWSEDQSDYFVLSIGTISTVYSLDALRREAGPKLLAMRDQIKTWL